MSHFLITLILSIGLLAAIGWATYWLHHKHGPHGEHLFRSLLALMVAGMVLLLTFGTNYVLASSGLKRSLGSERIIGDDPIARILFGGSHMRSNHLFALAVVVASFVSCACFLHAAGRLFEYFQTGAWRANHFETAKLIVNLAFVTGVAGYCLWLDSDLLLARTALMMYSDAYGAAGASLPVPSVIIHDHRREIGGYLLGILAVWYPLYILMAEKHFASCKAHYSAACRAMAASQAQAMAAPGGVAALPHGPVAPPAAGPGGGALGIGGLVAPAAPFAVAPFVVTPPISGAGADTPVPGGAAPLIRPVPFNPGPESRNGVH